MSKPPAKIAADVRSTPASDRLARGPIDATTMRNATVVVAVILTGAALKELGTILSSLALAIFLLMMIDGFAEVIERRLPFLPAWAPIVVALAIGIGAFGLTVYVVAEYAAGFRDKLLEYGPRLNGIIERFAAMFGVAAPPSIGQLFTRFNPAQYAPSFFSGVQSFTSNAVFVLIYLGFLLASRVGFAKKVVRLFPEREERGEAVEVAQRISQGVQRYLWIQTVTGAVIALIAWAVMWSIKLDNAAFWAFVIFVSSYIPIIGAAIGCFAPPIFALVQYTELWPAIMLAVVLNGVNFIVNNIILPRMQGESLNLDPVVLLLALAFWGYIWGLAGMFLSTPLTVMAMVVLAQFKGTHWIAVLLSHDGDPLGAERRKPGKKAIAEN